MLVGMGCDCVPMREALVTGAKIAADDEFFAMLCFTNGE